jgi:predicted ATPase
MLQLKSIALKAAAKNLSSYPFNLPIVRNFTELRFDSPITFFVGENGSGKSTLLEAIAAGTGAVTVGAEDIQLDASLTPARQLGNQLKFSWGARTHMGFFLRAEDFFGFSKRLKQMVKELDEIAEGFEQELTGYALSLAKGSVLGQKRELIDKYGEDLDANSHGEAFLKLFQARFVPRGLYLLDEPEAPLSPLRQLSLLSILKEMVEQEAQFIIATHSPILMAFSDAKIISFDVSPIAEIAYEETEHYSLTKAFLNQPETFLHRL